MYNRMVYSFVHHKMVALNAFKHLRHRLKLDVRMPSEREEEVVDGYCVYIYMKRRRSATRQTTERKYFLIMENIYVAIHTVYVYV